MKHDGITGRPGAAYEAEAVPVDGAMLIRQVDNILEESDLERLKEQTAALKTAFETGGLEPENGNGLWLKPKSFLEELGQITSAYTLGRARYYAQRLRKGLVEVKTSAVNDINLRRWKDYDDILTDSLWNIERRDGSGAHLGWYWGNFIPQIPHQLMLRYTKRGDLVVDPFAGSGTTLIECRRLGRHGAGVEINPDTAERARERIEQEANPFNVATRLTVGDSRVFDFGALIRDLGRDAVDLYLMHPPYHDIIRFTDNNHDLSNASGTTEFLRMFGEVLDNTLPLLRKGRFVGIVIGDKYHRGEWIPLGFYCMQEAMQRGLTLKSIIVKNFEETKGKRNQKGLWRYRALAGGFYVFKHEYILILRK